ncbi:hypothetical protein ACHAXH_005562 [Discostella pseudostelligera]
MINRFSPSSLFHRDILAFLEQLLPSKPISLFRPYRFSPADLAKRFRDDDGRHHGDMLPIEARGTIQEANYSTTFVKYFDILSYNVNNVVVHNKIRRRRILHAIFSSGAHIVLLQETNSQWEEELEVLQKKDDLYRYSYFHLPGRDDRAAGGIAILSQFPLEDVRVVDFSKDVPGSVFPALICGVKLPIRYQRGESAITHDLTINVAVVHLRPPVELDGTAWLDTARRTAPIRLREVQELIKRSAVVEQERGRGERREGSRSLHIIAGDFNEGDDSEAITHLTNLGYTNALQTFVPRWKETHTWPFMRNWLLLRKRLDHVLWRDGPLFGTVTNGCGIEMECSVKLQCIGCGVVTGYEVDASDHQPILSRFALVKD